MRKPVIVIGGPTASGKSGLALGVATQANGTVINADSMQVYDDLPILTAQPSAADVAQAPHRLYNTLPADQPCSAAQWRELALTEIRNAQKEGRLPIIVGGTGFYMSALMEGLSPIPDVPAHVRDALTAEQRQTNTASLFAQLQQEDPVTAARIDGHNTQRVIRALEVLRHTGIPLAEWQDRLRVGVPEDIRFITVALLPEREKLHAHCDQRFLMMIEQGVLDEIENFDRRGIAQSPLHKALGYPELSAYRAGTLTKSEAILQAQAATRQYAKRQTTWFRNQWEADLVLETPDADAVLRNL